MEEIRGDMRAEFEQLLRMQRVFFYGEAGARLMQDEHYLAAAVVFALMSEEQEKLGEARR